MPERCEAGGVMEQTVPRTGMIFDRISGRTEAVYAFVAITTELVDIDPRAVSTVHRDGSASLLAKDLTGVYV